MNALCLESFNFDFGDYTIITTYLLFLSSYGTAIPLLNICPKDLIAHSTGIWYLLKTVTTRLGNDKVGVKYQYDDISRHKFGNNILPSW